MIYAGYFASILIGITLGLIGGGGSILTVPVLVYLLGVEPVMATAYSLFIVGISSLIGAYTKYKEGLVHLKTSIIFGIPSIASVYATRKFILPAIPDVLFSIDEFQVTKPLFLMLLFAILMVVASISMIRGDKEKSDKEDVDVKHLQLKFNYPLILIEGTVVGILTGLVGAGGGFLIIPALVMLSKLPMKMAVGSSLLIIAAKSLIGFIGDIQTAASQMDWMLLLIVSALAIVGIFIGNRLSLKINGNKLKKGFGWFVLTMGIYILIKEGFFNHIF
jgi:uncharacterized membrane protein YfcA